MHNAVIVAATRTAVGKFGGSLKDISPGRLGAAVVKAAMDQAQVEPGEIDDVIMGHVLSAGHGQNVARQAALWAGLPETVSAFCVNKVCGSGLKAIALGAQAVMAGDDDVVIAGGVENMSMTPYASMGDRWGLKMGNSELTDLMIHDGLWDVFHDYHMGVTAENVAEEYDVSREDQDAFAAASQNKAETAIKEGKFKDEITQLEIPQRKGEPIVFDTDEFPRFGTTPEILAKLKPAFKKDGTVTAGNSAGVNDGAAAVVLMSEERAREKGLEPFATVASYGACGLPPETMGVGPIDATKKATARAGVKGSDLDLIEINEAFAAQSVAVIRGLGLDPERVNVNGGGIALGHPIGASGARVVVTLVHELKRRDATTGLATLCIGGGQGVAMVMTR